MIEKDGLKQRMSVFFNKAKNILNKVKIPSFTAKIEKKAAPPLIQAG